MAGTTKRPPTSSGYVLLLVGIALTSIANVLHGFAHGAALGAGIVLVVGSAVLLGASTGSRRRQGQGWLPSRDGDG